MAADYRQVPPNSQVPNRAVPSYPTPVVSDRIYREIVSTEVGTYTPLEYGVRFKDYHQAPFSPELADFQLVFQVPVDNNGFWVARIWCNPRTDQKSYDYSLSFMSEDPEYPQVTRMVVVKRSEYNLDPPGPAGPLPPLTPDETWPDALLVQEQMLNQTDPAEINSLYVTIARVYMVLPGPITLSQDFDSELNTMVSTSRQLVLSTDVLMPEYYPLLLEARETPSSKYYKLRIMSYLESLPPSKTEYNVGTYAFPTLIPEIELATAELTPGRSEVYYSTPDARLAPNCPALIKIFTSFSIGEPAPVNIFYIPERDLFYRGISYQISFNRVLNDRITTDAIFIGDERYGNLNESHTFEATPISATEYLTDYVGTYQNIGAQISRWRGQLYVSQTSSVLLV